MIMAQYKRHYVQDLQEKIEIRRGDLVFNSDADSVVITVDILDGGEATALSGTAAGAVIRSDGTTVPVTNATVSGNTVAMLLTGACFSVPGDIGVGIQLTSNGVKTTILKAIFNVELFETPNVIDPAGTITLSIGNLVSAIDTAVAAIPEDYTSLQNSVSALMREDYWDSGKAAEMKYAGYVDGYYRNYTNGAITENALYSYSGNIHILPYSYFKIVNAYGDVHVTYWDDAGDFISGELLGSTHGDTLTIPTNCDSVVLSYATSERNQIALTYVNNVLSVGVGRQFETISAAVAVANDGDTIIVYPGVYTEAVDAYAKKVHIRGISKAQCLLTYSANNYAYPPLQMAKGSVSNMTIYASWSGDTTNPRAYCVHIDSDYERGETLAFDNVDFVTDRGDCVGIGTRTDFHLKFTNCLFHAKYGAQSGCIYNHDSESESTGINGYNVYENQNVEYINCTMINESTAYTIVLQSQERLEGCCHITFTGNKVIQPNNDGKTIAMVLWQDRHLTNNHYLGSSDFILTTISALNTYPILDYSA